MKKNLSVIFQASVCTVFFFIAVTLVGAITTEKAQSETIIPVAEKNKLEKREVRMDTSEIDQSVRERLKIIIFDCFGVVFDDKFKEFLKENENSLKNYLNSDKASLEDKKLGFPKFYYSLATQIDMKMISDEEFYHIFAEASGKNPQLIQQIFNDTNCLQEEIVKIIIDLKSKGYKTVLIANADREFLQKFIDKDISSINSSFQKLDNVFDMVITSSEIKSHKCSPAMLQAIFEHFDIIDKSKDIVVIDDSKKNVRCFHTELGVPAIHYQNPSDLMEKLRSLTTSSFE